MVEGQKTFIKPKEIADRFCKTFAKISNFRPRQKKPRTIVSGCLNEKDFFISNNSFSMKELQVALNNTPTGKTPGTDGIHSEFLKHMGLRAKEVLLRFINLTWTSGYIPDLWRKSQVIPILKKDKPGNLFDSYRPISLTSAFCKVVEKMVLCRLQKMMRTNKGISYRQAGFMKNRNTIEQIAYLSQQIKDGFHRKQSTMAIFIDFSSAFDRVWKAKLIEKLVNLGIAGNLIAWIRAFLSQRHFNVKFRECNSKYSQLKQGLPQGSVLSPFLFNVMVDDIIKSVMEKVPGTEALLYADDLIVWGTSSNIRSLELWANEALTVLDKWALQNEMIINPTKTTFQLFTLSTKQHQLEVKIRNQPIPRTYEAKYLGMVMDSKMTWEKHSKHSAAKGESRLKLLKRLTGIKWGASTDVLTTAYKSYIRPVLEYGSEILVTASHSVTTRLDLVQNKALRIILGAARSTPITAMLLQTGLEPLGIRREKNAISLYERVLRLNDSYWPKYKEANQRLKTQITFTTTVKQLISKLGINLDNRAVVDDLLDFSCAVGFKLETELVEPVSKSATPNYMLKELALKTIAERYPEEEWFHLYTDGSAEGACRNGGAGVYSRSFQLSKPVGKWASNFDGEIGAIELALDKLEGQSFDKAALFSDSLAALISIARSKSTADRVILECRKKLFSFYESGKEVVMQWVPAHCGLIGNEQADRLARIGAALPQPEVPISLDCAKRMVSAAYKEISYNDMKVSCEGKRWARLLNPKDRIPLHLPRKVAVACFRLLTGHDYLQHHLHGIGVAGSPLCNLCSEAEDMTAEHLFRCPAINNCDFTFDDASYITLAEYYWAARTKMAEMPQMA